MQLQRLMQFISLSGVVSLTVVTHLIWRKYNRLRTKLIFCDSYIFFSKCVKCLKVYSKYTCRCTLITHSKKFFQSALIFSKCAATVPGGLIILIINLFTKYQDNIKSGIQICIRLDFAIYYSCNQALLILWTTCRISCIPL